MARLVDLRCIGSHFVSLADGRHLQNLGRLRVDGLFIAVAGPVFDCHGPTAMHRRACLHRDWLSRRLPSIRCGRK